MNPYLINHSDISPERIRRLPEAFFRNASDMTFREIAYVVLEVLLGDEIRPDILKTLVDRSLSDTCPFSPEAEAAFVPELSLETQPIFKTLTLLCAVEPEDFHLANAMARRTDLCILVPRGSHAIDIQSRVIEVLGSATDCLYLCSQLERSLPMCSLHNAAAAAVRIAIAIYCATRSTIPQQSSTLIVKSAAMLRAYQTAIEMGLRCGTPELDTDAPSRPPHPTFSTNSGNRRKPERVAPTVEAVMRALTGGNNQV